jgi:hypothetical protein
MVISVTGRQTFFSFHYRRDVWRAANIRNSKEFDARAAAGWNDASLWESTKLRGRDAVRRVIDDGLKGTSVTVVLIGAETSKREWVDYEIERSYERGNGVIGVRIHRLKDQFGNKDRRGETPARLLQHKAVVHDYDSSSLGGWIELAAIAAGKQCLRHGAENCILCRLRINIFG